MSYTAIIFLLFICCYAIPRGIFSTSTQLNLLTSHNITFLTGSAEHTSLQVSENNGSSVFVELLRGRDGLPGRDGVQGPPGPPGKDGSTGPPGPSSGGVTYTRWGKSSCPEVEDTKLVYSGRTGGMQFYEHGGGANHLCMPENPEYSDTLKYNDGEQGVSRLYGSEYQDPVLQGTHDHNVPCAVCYVSTRQSVLMIPAKVSCPKNWTMEYYGYLMTEHKYHRRSMFECVDKDLEPIPNSRADTNGALFFHVEADCDSGLPCSPYNNYKELNCVVCTI